MKVSATKTVQVGDVTPSRQLRLDALVNILQEMAIAHTREVGIELSSLLDSGKTWVLSKMYLDLKRLPTLDEKVEVQTWSRSIERFKGVRDFTFSVEGKHIASASTLWLYIDIARRRPVRVPDHYESLYESEKAHATGLNVEHWTHPESVADNTPLIITTRISDFDVNGHVNNAVILQYIQTAVTRSIGSDIAIQSVRLAYLKEIPENVREVEVLVEKIGDCCNFQLGHASAIFASGTLQISDATR